MSDSSGPLTHDQALALIGRTTDPGWFTGMVSQPDGQAILNALADVGAAASERLHHQIAACSIDGAPAGRKGVSVLRFTRPATAATATIPKGYTFVDSRGVELQVTLDVPVAAWQTDVLLPLQTMRQIDLVNNTEPAFDDMLGVGYWLDDILSPLNAPVLDSAFVPLLLIGAGVATYASSDPITLAELDWLSAHGDERGCRRQPNEDGEAYRLRVRAIPDAVTPKVIQEAVHGAQVQGLLPDTYMVEPYRDQATDAARLALELIFSDSVFCEDYCDDGLGVDIVGKLPLRTLEAPGLREGRAYFRQAVVGKLTEPDGSGCYCDDAFVDDPEWGYLDMGLHPVLVAALRGIHEEARVKKAGGVQFDTFVENGTRLDGYAEVTAIPTGTMTWVLTAAPGTAWLIRQGLVTVSGPFDPATDVAVLFFLLADGSWVVSEPMSKIDGMPLRTFELVALGYHSEPVVLIALVLYSSVSNVLQGAGTFWTTEMTL